jgi:N12 class adenine-specific DNA methylase
MRRVQAEGRPADPDEQAVLARWSGWGSLPKVFDPADDDYADVRARLRELLNDAEWSAAARTTLNAHYTSWEAADAIWRAVRRAGFTGGRVLEPGVGAGTFLATRPGDIETIDAVGVEVDPVTAGIARLLHPEATIRSESFAATRYPDGWFDLTVGNVPFGNYKLFDPLHNRAGLTIHNYFIHKSLAMTRPGGYVAVLTSCYTLDALNATARAAMAETADLVGALRLPDGAMQAVAGTEAGMDLVVLRRRAPDAVPAGEPWLSVADVDTPEGQVRINEVFAAHPDWVLGDLGVGRGRYADGELVVRARRQVVNGREQREPLGPAMNIALQRIVEQATSAGLGFTERTRAREVSLDAGDVEWVADVTVGPHHVEGSLLARDRGGFARIENGIPIPYAPPAAQCAELSRLIELRDTYFEVIDGQAASPDDTDWEAARQLLNTRYDAYVRLYGPVNRYRTYDTGRRDDVGRPVLGRRWPPMGGFRADPGLPVVRALEDFDDHAQTATKAPIFERRVLSPRQPVTAVDRPEDALALCLDERGQVDVETIGRLLGCDPTEARARLGSLVFDDPDGGPPVPAATYLSGHVRSKLRAARSALAEDGECWQANVAALEAVQPRDLEPGEIDARLGAPWIPLSDIKAFCADVLDAPDTKIAYTRVTGAWTLTGTGRGSLALTSDWGTRRMDGIHLTEAACNQSEVTVTDPDPSDPDGRRRIVNLPETLAAREKKEAISERFATWVWEDPERSARLVEHYNELFNSTVLPTYDGSHLSFPGLADGFVPHQHQRDAVWRILSEPSTLLAHAVGAGKTATMVMAGREMKRLGLINRPCYVVPNHMLEQFSREYLQLYPDAKILVASKDDVTPARRKELIARCAAQDWDAVIMTSASFERIPVSAATEAAFLEAKSAELRAAIAQSTAAGDANGITVKALEKALVRSEERHARLLDERRDDGGVTCEATGIDYLIIDEAHRYKNLYFPTRIQGVSGSASKRAEDLDMKLRWLREAKGARVVTFATATPISNSIAEMWVMQHYLQPDALSAAGIEHFDGWAATFARAVTALEMAPDTTTYRMKTRFARFANVPDLLKMFRAVADVRHIDQLGLVVPDVAGGGAETVVVAGTEELKQFGLELAARAAEISAGRVDPHDDNMLKITSDGRKAALDLRLVGLGPDPTGGKLAAVADRIAGTYHRNSDLEYPGSTRRGALQLVFLDISTPNSDGQWNAYDQLRSDLSGRGVPVESIRFIHEARNDAEKARLFSAARSGAISVLIGSTERMGVGTNVQDRVIALHDVDCPWRPADLEQRAGRAIRQGNANRVVALLRYVTRDSFDSFFWQTVERKAAFIHQVMAGEVTERWVEDIGDEALSYAEVKALATGDPRIMERAGVTSELSKLQRLEAAWRNDQARLRSRAAAGERDATRLAALAAALRAAAPHAIDTSGDKFVMTIGGHTHDKRTAAADALRRMVLRDCTPHGGEGKTFPLGRLAGFDLAVTAYRDREETTYSFHLDGIPTPTKLFTRKQLSQDAPLGMLLQIEHLAENLDHRAADAERDAAGARRDTDQARERLDRPFEHTERIASLAARLEQIDASLADVDTSAMPSATDGSISAASTNGSDAGTPRVAQSDRVAAEQAGLDQAGDRSQGRGEPQAWYDEQRRLHREGGPAYIAVDGSLEWWVHGERHRDDGPAIEAADGTRAWYQRGQLHRCGGPALEDADGRKQWFHHGIRQSVPQPSPPAAPDLEDLTPTPVGVEL